MDRMQDFLWLSLRLGFFWVSVLGWGSVAQWVTDRKWLIPWHLAGIISMILLSVPLSIFGLLNRTVLPILISIGAIIGIFRAGVYIKSWSCKCLLGWKSRVLIVIAVFLLLSNLFRASVPHTNPDALTTYAVQPDRWLNAGRITYLEEIKHSAYPMIGEIIACWPASLSTSRTDQLSLLQLFQMSMLLAACYAAWQFVRNRTSNSFYIIVATCMGTSMLAGWASLPKIEMTLLYFTTLAFCCLYKQLISGEKQIQVISVLAMGLALGTKLTAWVLLPSFLFFALSMPGYRKAGTAYRWILLLFIPPAVFGIRSVVHTGTPFYPFSVPFIETDIQHQLPDVAAIDSLAELNTAPNELLVNRSSIPFFTNIIELAESWDLPALLLLLGLSVIILKRRITIALVPLSTIVLYMIFASLFFNPLTWGAKYAFLLSPFMAFLGTSWSEELRKPPFAFYGFLSILILTSSIVPRFRYSTSYITSSNRLEFRSPNIVAVKPLHEWCNDNLSQGTRLLSLWKRERYFSDHQVIVLENHPLGRRLLIEEGLYGELQLLSMMGVDYIYFESCDPMPGNLEDYLEILRSDHLVYVTEISGFTLMRVIQS